MNKRTEELIRIAQDLDNGVITHIGFSQYSEQDDKNTRKMLQLSQQIIAQNLSVAEVIECFYGIYMIAFSPQRHLNDDVALKLYNKLNDFDDSITELTDKSLSDSTKHEIDIKEKGRMALEATQIAHGGPDYRGLMWQLKDNVFEDIDFNKLDRLGEITSKFVQLDPEVAKALELLNEFIELFWISSEEYFDGDLNKVKDWSDKIESYLADIFFPFGN